MTPNSHLELSTLETWLWDAACKIRGPVDAPKYKDYILPLVFLKRLSDVFEDEVKDLAEDIGDEKTAQDLVEHDHKNVRLYLPPQSRWSYIANLSVGKLGESLTDAMRAVVRENPKLSGVIDITDFNATAAGQRIISDDYLHALIQVLNQHRLGLHDVEPDILGRAYEYLLRKFAEGQGQSAGEFYTPRMVGVLMAKLLNPEPGMTVYDPACGSSGLLIKCHLELLEKYGEQKNSHKVLPENIAPIKVYGQEINPVTYAMSRMNTYIHDIDAEIAIGDTMRNPRFLNEDGSLKQFDLVTANPMWNQTFPTTLYENDSFDRFGRGIPPSSSADWGWVQHMFSSLGPNGRMAVVLDTGAVSRGSGNLGSNKEREVRRAFIDSDLIESVFLMPENLFYNTTAAGIILTLNKNKSHPGEILLVNASRLFISGRPKNELDNESLQKILEVLHDWREEQSLSKIISTSEIINSDYNLSPNRYVNKDDESPILPIEEAILLLREAEEDRKIADNALNEIFGQLGIN
jgi:type I restriction enzyme M protein